MKKRLTLSALALRLLAVSILLPTSYAESVSSLVASIPAGSFDMGASDFYPEEGVLENVTVEAFDIDQHEVTNAQFAAFVTATNYVTVAERKPNPKDYPDVPPALLVAGSAVFFSPEKLVSQDVNQWWRFVPDANWRQPAGPGSNVDDTPDHPVVHIAYADAKAYADWKGRALPTEAQWEYAAKSGLAESIQSWSRAIMSGDTARANTWQGQFPLQNTAKDGFVGTAPVGSFVPNRYGVHDLIGNVWEWTSDWYYPTRDGRPDRTQGYDPMQPDIPVKAIKGGSYLCSPGYCARFRPSARMAQDTNFSASHIGFRTVSKAASTSTTAN